MGYSYGYNLFTGFAEVISGVLLLFRRTTAIGAFMAFIVSANIVAMNYSFDIPVKLLSSTMILMSLFLLGENVRRLWGLFFQNRTTRLHTVPRPRFRKKAPRIALAVVKYLLIAYVIVGYAISYLEARTQYGDRAPHVALYGIYNTRSFVLNGETLAPLQTDSVRWKQLIIDGSPTMSFAGIKMMNDSMRRYRVATDSLLHLVTITDFADSANNWKLNYLAGADSLILWGKHFGSKHFGRKDPDSIRVTLIRYPLEKFRLNSRGFNWINEFPNNR
ncbi:MAG TPA: hypothetical protein VKU83_11330, partial [Puia sp.]|nr:hypothetical protein [Puia sp.]